MVCDIGYIFKNSPIHLVYKAIKIILYVGFALI